MALLSILQLCFPFRLSHPIRSIFSLERSDSCSSLSTSTSSSLFASTAAGSEADDFRRMRDYFVNPDDSIFEWYEMSGCTVVLPMNTRVPSSIVHFIGGFLAGSAVKASYQSLLEELTTKGHLVVATPLPPFEVLSNHPPPAFWLFPNLLQLSEIRRHCW